MAPSITRSGSTYEPRTQPLKSQTGYSLRGSRMLSGGVSRLSVTQPCTPRQNTTMTIVVMYRMNPRLDLAAAMGKSKLTELSRRYDDRRNPLHLSPRVEDIQAACP